MADNYQKIITAIKTAKTPAVICHMRPDGDTLGSALALKAVMPNISVYCESVISSYYDILPDIKTVISAEIVPMAHDLLIAVDCGDSHRLGKNKKAFLKHRNTINIDHHGTNESFAALNFVRPKVSSTGELVFNLIKDMGFALNKDAAECLYIAVCTDTGNFTQSNTSPESYLMAAELIKFNIDVSYLNRKLYSEMPYNKVKLLAKVLDGLKLYTYGKISLTDLSLKTLNEYGCKSCDTEGFVEYAINTEGVLIGILLTEIARNSYKASLRSRPGVDVSRPAAYFNGGGHKQASGCIISGKIEDVIDKLVFECSKEI